MSKYITILVILSSSFLGSYYIFLEMFYSIENETVFKIVPMVVLFAGSLTVSWYLFKLAVMYVLNQAFCERWLQSIKNMWRLMIYLRMFKELKNSDLYYFTLILSLPPEIFSQEMQMKLSDVRRKNNEK